MCELQTVRVLMRNAGPELQTVRVLMRNAGPLSELTVRVLAQGLSAPDCACAVLQTVRVLMRNAGPLSELQTVQTVLCMC